MPYTSDISLRMFLFSGTLTLLLRWNPARAVFKV